MLKRMVSFLLVAVFVVSVFVLNVQIDAASTNNNVDVNFVLPIQNNVDSCNTLSSSRIKRDYSSSYVNYKKNASGVTSTGPYEIEVIVYGAAEEDWTYYDCTRYTYDGQPRTKAIVRIYTEGFVRQDVAERFGVGSWGQIYGRMAPNSTSGTAIGCWSVDSVGSGTYYNQLA